MEHSQITQHTNKVWGSKLKKLEKCDFYAILNGKQLKKLLEVVTQNLKIFQTTIGENLQGCLTPNILFNACYFSVNPPPLKTGKF